MRKPRFPNPLSMKSMLSTLFPCMRARRAPILRESFGLRGRRGQAEREYRTGLPSGFRSTAAGSPFHTPQKIQGGGGSATIGP